MSPRHQPPSVPLDQSGERVTGSLTNDRLLASAMVWAQRKVSMQECSKSESVCQEETRSEPESPPCGPPCSGGPGAPSQQVRDFRASSRETGKPGSEQHSRMSRSARGKCPPPSQKPALRRILIPPKKSAEHHYLQPDRRTRSLPKSPFFVRQSSFCNDKSGRGDSNPRPLGPEPSALAGLRYAPITDVLCWRSPERSIQ